jgi:hypothetical protein
MADITASIWLGEPINAPCSTDSALRMVAGSPCGDGEQALGGTDCMRIATGDLASKG